MGEYLSALANAAALLRKDRAYIVWGIEDVMHKVVGASFKPRQTKKGNEELENWLGRLLQPRLDFRVHEFAHEGKPVVLFEVPAASHTPVRFSGEEFIRVGSYKKKLKDYPEKERALWSIFQKEDWSAQLLPGASLDDLDPEALVFARQEYAKKQPRLAAEAKQWDDRTFLNKAKLCVQGKITRTAIILLGRSEAEHFLSTRGSSARRCTTASPTRTTRRLGASTSSRSRIRYCSPIWASFFPAAWKRSSGATRPRISTATALWPRRW